ncbi:MAG: hypothetical protein A4E28_00022 [Methanocella sp. PtaU1.Bin125]|nr:MAG: hypothetical protein A4E28_00022 [Methanocella sp. PtaU1.Bin125]
MTPPKKSPMKKSSRKSSHKLVVEGRPIGPCETGCPDSIIVLNDKGEVWCPICGIIYRPDPTQLPYHSDGVWGPLCTPELSLTCKHFDTSKRTHDSYCDAYSCHDVGDLWGDYCPCYDPKEGMAMARPGCWTLRDAGISLTEQREAAKQRRVCAEVSSDGKHPIGHCVVCNKPVLRGWNVPGLDKDYPWGNVLVGDCCIDIAIADTQELQGVKFVGEHVAVSEKPVEASGPRHLVQADLSRWVSA